jgi:hypothetical protein
MVEARDLVLSLVRLSLAYSMALFLATNCSRVRISVLEWYPCVAGEVLLL